MKHNWKKHNEPIKDDDFEICSHCGVIRTTRKAHRNTCIAATNCGMHYYSKEDMNTLIGGIPQNKYYTELHQEFFDHFGRDLKVLEVGCGIGPFIPQWLSWGWNITVIEYDNWAARYVEHAYPPVKVYQGDFLSTEFHLRYDLVVACHSLEHFKNSDLAFEKICSLGEMFYIEVPDASDLYIQDHWWHFDERTLPQWTKDCGRTVSHYSTKQGQRSRNFHIIGR